MSHLDATLIEVAAQYDEVQAQLSRPEVSADPSEIRRLGQELSRLQPTVEAFRRLNDIREELAGARELREASASDDEMHAMARDEIARLETEETRLLDELKVLLLPRDPNDDRDVILEVRAGAGGDEAALFAAELLRMYLRYAANHRFHAEVLSLNETGIDGIKEAIAQVRGDGAYSRLKFEGGVHRVQRVPATESSGRIHTSTATVVVMPEADEVEIEIDEERDLRIDVKRASGPGASRSTRRTLPSASRTCRPGLWWRSRTRRVSTRTRPRRCPSCAHASWTSRSRSSGRRIRRLASRWSAAATGATRCGPTTSRRTG